MNLQVTTKRAYDVKIGDTVLIERYMDLRQHLDLEEEWMFEVDEVTYHKRNNEFPFCDNIFLFCHKNGASASLQSTEIVYVIEE